MKFCGSCGAQMPDEALVCGNCGTPLQATQVPQQDAQQPVQQDAQQAFQQQPYQQQVYQQPYQQMGYQQQPYQQQPFQQQDYQQQPYQQQVYQQQPYQQMGYQQQPYQQKMNANLNPNSKGKAIAALVCGIIGLVLSFFAWVTVGVTAILGLTLCIVGIVLGVKARNEIPDGTQGRGMATGGLVCAIIGAVLSGIIAVCTLCVLGCAACADAGAASYAYNSSNWYTILFM